VSPPWKNTTPIEGVGSVRFRSLVFCLVVLAVLLLAGCDEYALSSAAPPPAGVALELAPASYIIEADELQISIRLATDELLSGYAEYLDLSEFVDGDLRIMFTSNMLVRGFSILALGYEDGEPYEERVLIAQKAILRDR